MVNGFPVLFVSWLLLAIDLRKTKSGLIQVIGKFDQSFLTNGKPPFFLGHLTNYSRAPTANN